MIELSGTLTAHQQSLVRHPALHLEASARRGGHAILHWAPHHDGNEADTPHAAAFSDDGVLIRARNANGTLSVARTTEPGPESTFDTWQTIGGCTPDTGLALAASGSDILLVSIEDGAIHLRTSSDGGASWGAPATLVSAAARWLALAVAPDGDACLFYTVGATLFRLRRTAGSWAGAGTAWSNTAAGLTGIAAAHFGGDYQLIVTGSEDGSGHRRVWGLSFGDGTLPANAWTGLRTITGADTASGMTFGGPSLAVLDGRLRASFSARESGPVATSRAMLTHPAHTGGVTGEWVEPVPQGTVTDHGLALLEYEARAWACGARTVASAPLPGSGDPLGAHLLRATAEMTERSARCRAEIVLGAQGLAAFPSLAPGSALTFRPGYRSGSDGGDEYGATYGFIIREVRERIEHGRRIAIVEGHGIWEELRAFVPPQSWQVSAGAATRGVLHGRIVARAGFGAASDAPTPGSRWLSETPAFVLGAGESGAAALERLMRTTTELLRHDSATVSTVRGRDAGESPVASYGPEAHPVHWLERIETAAATTAIRLAGESRHADAADASAVARHGLRQHVVYAPEFTTDGEVQSAAQDALARHRGLQPVGRLAAPVHAGLQLWDVISVDEPRLGVAGQHYRVIAMTMRFDRERGTYEHELLLAAP